MASSVEKDEVVSLELPAPPGWKKKVFSLAFPVCSLGFPYFFSNSLFLRITLWVWFKLFIAVKNL